MDKSKRAELDELVNRFLRGESVGQQIVEILWAPVDSFFTKLRVPPGDAPDLVEEFLSALLDRKIFGYKPQPGASFWSWLAKGVVRKAGDWRRHQTRIPERADSEFIAVADARSALVAERAIAPSRRTQAVLSVLDEHAFRRLSAADQDVLRLRIVAGFDYDLIADVLHPGLEAEARERLSNSLKTRFCRAKARLRKLVVDYLRADLLRLQQERTRHG